jgi:hypothetical protein
MLPSFFSPEIFPVFKRKGTMEDNGQDADGQHTPYEKMSESTSDCKKKFIIFVYNDRGCSKQ